MKIIICVDYSTHTENILKAANFLLGTRVPQPKISVVHVIDQTLLSSGTGNEQWLMDDLKENSETINKLAKHYLGSEVQYIEAYGIPQVEIDEILKNATCDLVIIGTKGRSLLNSLLLGSTAEHLVHNLKIPVLVVPMPE